ncbi:MAG: class I SAM-dependent methyltransferase [Lutibacter sp.]
MSDFIKAFWENQAIKHRTSHSASWGDNYAIDLEIETIGSHIKESDIVLDIGCANGFSTFKQLSERKPAKIYGVDFSPNMIKFANKVRDKCSDKEKIEFREGDIRNIKFEDNKFDIVYTTRVLINLPTWEEQMLAMDECFRVVKPGGKIIFSEAFYEPLMLLNSMRLIKQLPPLVEHDFNRYIKKAKIEKYLTNKCMSFVCNDFSSIYYLGSRFLRELVTNSSNYPGYTNPINEIFYEIEKKYSGGGFGIQQAYIIETK